MDQVRTPDREKGHKDPKKEKFEKFMFWRPEISLWTAEGFACRL